MALPSGTKASLQGFLARDSYSYQNFPSRVNPQLWQLARKLAPDLPADLHTEIVNETWVTLLEKPPVHYGSERGAENTYLTFAVRDAIKRIRASYRPPGSPSRDREHQTISLEAQVEAGAQFVDDKQILAEDKLSVAEILDRMDRLTAEALLRVHVLGQSIQEVAVAQHRSRFQVGRCISTAIETWREAA